MSIDPSDRSAQPDGDERPLVHSTPAQALAVEPAPTQLPAAGAVVTLSPGSVAPVLLHMPVSIRSLSLVMLAIFAGLFVLRWAQAVFIPVMLGLMFSYALSPLVNWLQARHIPRWLGSALLLIAIFSAIATAAYSLSDETVRLVESLPAAAQKFRQTVMARRDNSDSTLETVQKAAAQIEQATQDGAPSMAQRNSRGAMRVEIEPSRFNIKNYLWTGTLGLATLVGQVTVVVFLTYFFMVSGDTFRRKLVKLTGPGLAKKKITLQALDEITVQIQRYLQVQLFTSALVGLLTGVALRIIGLENAAVWGIAAGVFNLVPYVGSLVTAAASGLVGLLQFGSLNMAFVVAGASVLIHTVVGNLVTPWLTSRASRMNPVAVFVGLLAWGWLWGVWGLLLGIPVLMIVKSVCDRVDDLKPVGEFLGS